MINRNPHLANLSPNYLFPEVNQRKKDFLKKYPDAKLISLGIGDTSEPLDPFVVDNLKLAAHNLGTEKYYSGYGAEIGKDLLRERISKEIYHNKVPFDDITISDGAKCDLGRLQLLFGSKVSIAVQDPAYPVYVDGSLLQGVENIIHLPCTPENHFWPDFTPLKNIDLIYWCSPNNPTGTVSTHEQLKELVALAKKLKSIIIFDAAYSGYIQDSNLPRSIFEIEGAEEVAIEVGSFSKLAGFSGIRLGWTVVPSALKYANGLSVKNDWRRLISTIFNGASNIAQAGGEAFLELLKSNSSNETIQFYLKNSRLIKDVIQKKGYKVYGGNHAPYLWVQFPQKNSWQAFQDILERLHIVTTPGIGFGASGDGFLRFSSFGHQSTIDEAVTRLQQL